MLSNELTRNVYSNGEVESEPNIKIVTVKWFTWKRMRVVYGVVWWCALFLYLTMLL